MKPQIVNIINFIRGSEPRDPHLDLYEPIANQIRLLKKYKLPGTFLIQYDAMLRDDFIRLLKTELDENHEIGGWFEIVRPLVERAGIEWKGRAGFDWDWHAHISFSLGYTKEEREKLVDVFMADFKSIFGYYPLSVGSWIIDAHTLAYMADRYGIVASCNCKDQWGTDGYTLWGGYYNQAYYPSLKNVFTPAHDVENRIPVPVFRMSGSDPIYQYDAGLSEGINLTPVSWQPVVSIEPASGEGGGSPDWVQWYFKENFNGICLSFGYTQVGQENSFGWKAMSDGLTYQLELIAGKYNAGELRVETLRDSGVWFGKTYDVTPASVVAALSDWKGQTHKSVWYCSRFYRVNLMWKGNRFWIRDMHLFNDDIEERYLNDRCKGDSFIYNNLPVMDGYRWSRGSIRAGIYPVKIEADGSTVGLKGREPDIGEIGDEELLSIWPLEDGGELQVRCCSESIMINAVNTADNLEWALQMSWGEDTDVPIGKVCKNSVNYHYQGYDYRLQALKGCFLKRDASNAILIHPEKGEIKLSCRIS